MSTEVNVAHVNQYKAQVEHLLQQKGKLRPCVNVGTYHGKGVKAINQLGEVTAVRNSSRHADTPYVWTPHAARWIAPADYDIADLVDEEDDIRMLISVEGPYAEAQAKALMRGVDQEIIAAFFATSKTGEDGDDTESFDTGNYQIAVGAVGLTVDKLKTASQKFRAAKVDFEEEELYIAVGSIQIKNLLDETQVTSADYNVLRPLVEGQVTKYMGFNIIPHEELLVDASAYRRVPAWCKSGMHLGIWRDKKVTVDRMPTKRNANQVYSKLTCGATRTQQGKVIEILCSEA